MSRKRTKFTGVYYRETTTNEKPDKTYYITFKNAQNKMQELKIGKFSEGIREQYCNLKRNEILTKLRLGEEVHLKHRQKDKIYLKDIAEEYFNTRTDSESKNKDISSYKKHLLSYFENTDLSTIDKKDIQLFKKIKLETPLAPKTVNNILTLLGTIIKYGISEELLTNDISKFIKKDNIDNDRERFLTVSEINKLYKAVEDDKRLYLFCKLSLTTGARLASTMNIRKKDINFTHKIITLKDFKNNTTYKAFLKDDVVELLKDYTADIDHSEKLFDVNNTTIQKPIREILNDLFNKKVDTSDRKNRVVVHSLRHTFASHLAINGTPIFTIQKLMNHKDIKMTLRYAKLADHSGRNEVDNLEF
ncbi:site-specific integrase [Sulfurimonas sp.]|uniref:tyrosine-type recombinase/integrase n=1 Tax=Sulfurimonas sp. TaxID=2022749 RepID=UPI002617425F|nr:site-specific integrase [Sulfurimonas sp.]MDD3450672.1 site-specific integrase [Sulfurimonas sp.]